MMGNYGRGRRPDGSHTGAGDTGSMVIPMCIQNLVIIFLPFALCGNGKSPFILENSVYMARHG